MILVLGDRSRDLRFNFNSLRWLESELGNGKEGPGFLIWFTDQLSEIVKDDNGTPLMDEDGKPQRVIRTPSFNVRAAFLWACMRHDDKALTVDQVGEMLQPDNLNETFEMCLLAFNEFYKPGSSRPLSEGSAGSNGGPSVATTSV